jgi:caa(3)-type oxidase subunit IV
MIMEKSQKHPSYLEYIGVFVALAVLTGLEIAASQMLPAVSPFRVPLLLGIAVGKAALVILFYMHLKYDSRVFGVIFLIPVFHAVGFIAALIFS